MLRALLRLTMTVAAFALFMARPVHATIVYCVADAATLQNDLAKYSQPNRTDDIELHVVQGTYAMGGQTGFLTGDGSHYKLSILGGYTAGCAARAVNPTNTVYDGQNVSTSGLEFLLDADLLIEGMTFTRLGYGVYIEWLNGSDGDTSTFRYNIVKNNSQVADGYDGVYLIGDANQTFIVHDNLFYGNAQVGHTIPGPTAALAVFLNDNTYAWIVNNTIAENPGIVGLQLIAGLGAHTFFVYDNIAWNNYSQDIALTDYDEGDSAANLLNNTYNTLSGSFATFNTGSNKTGAANDPLFLNPGAGDFHLGTQSTSINTGAASVPLYTYPSRDNDGGSRAIGSRVDRGAFESAIDDVNNLVVSLTTDNGSNTSPTVGSIRWAIKQANANAGASTITFSTPCPTVFNLPSQLPDITSDVTIDGYHTSTGASVAGAKQNSDMHGFNATLCPYLNGGHSIANAFRTSGSGRLTLTGVGFAGFTDAAVRLTTGSGHVITGNQIGAVPLAAANGDGIRVTGTVTDAAIGDGTVAGYNWIADNTGVGVYIDNAAGGVVVKYNVIGLDSGGAGSAGNANAVYVFNSRNNSIIGNYIDNSANAGITLSGISALYNIVQYNEIGVGGSFEAEGNLGAGVVINAGAAYNTIGASLAGSSGGNYIAYNGGPGVSISGGGVGNRVLANLSYSNTGLAVDLAADGPSSNDSLDSDTGANDMQNFPVVTGSNRSGASILLTGYLRSAANGSGFRVDFYRSAGCRSFAGAVRGDGRDYIGRGSVSTDASGFSNFAVLLPVGIGSAGDISATATAANGDTSEIGSCVNEDTVFKYGFEF